MVKTRNLYMTRNFYPKGEIKYLKPVSDVGWTDGLITIAYRVPADQPGLQLI